MNTYCAGNISMFTLFSQMKWALKLHVIVVVVEAIACQLFYLRNSLRKCECIKNTSYNIKYNDRNTRVLPDLIDGE